MRALAALLAVACLVAPAHAQTAAGDPVRGMSVYEQRCSGCHSLDANRVGPAHRGVHGRRAGTAPNFSYSSAVRGSGIVWNDAALDRWLTNPQALIPGQRMNFRLSDPRERADVIAYLRRESAPPPRN
jgi:cytochrome c